MRILAPNGYLILADLIESESSKSSWASKWKRLYLEYIKKNKTEAAAVYYDREEMIALLFEAGFRQVIMQGLNVPDSPHAGVFSLIAATK